MLHERPVAAMALPDMTGGVRERLAEIVTGIDARFVAVGARLETLVGTIDRVMRSLQGVGEVFQDGDATAAVRNLMRAADRLSGVSTQVADRTAEVRSIRSVSHRLCKHVEDVRKALEVLQIYGMNVKIAASGEKDFVDFADRMKQQLLVGEVDIGGFDVKLAELEEGISGTEESDRLLAIECARVVPQVPEQLIADAGELLAHQQKLAALAAEARGLAQVVQGHVCAILGAIQIGDIARQRLEHVLAACTLFEARRLDCGPAQGAAMRHHVMRMLVAQLHDSGADFCRETERLVTALRDIEPQARRLLDLHVGHGSADRGQLFLRRLETGIAEADTMTAQLHRADRQAEETIRITIDTVEDLIVRAGVVRNLRIDVQQMAINIGLRCRRMETIGRPVTVIANEIRGYSEKLDATIDGVTLAAEDLHAISQRMRGRGTEGAGSDSDLAQPLAAIRGSAQRIEEAISAADSDAGDILGMLRQTTDELARGLDLGGTIGQIASTLADLAGPEEPLGDAADGPYGLLMAEIARSYTMASERQVHERFCAIGTPAPPPPASALDEDDALFGDALF